MDPLAGTQPGRADLLAVNAGPSALQSFPNVPPGRYFVRVRGVGIGGVTPASNEVQVVVGAPSCSVPDPPAPLTFSVSGPLVTLQWSGVADADAFILGVGSSSGAFDLLVTQLAAGTTTLSAPVASGTYVVRMAALNACGLSGLSNEITVTVR